MAVSDLWTALRDWVTDEIPGATEFNQQLRDNLNVLLKTLTGDSSTQQKHAHATGTLAARPAAGNAGRLYYATDLGVLFVDDGTNWLILSHVPQISERLRDDFLLDTGGRWDETLTGSASIFLVTNKIRLRTGATNGSLARLMPRPITVPHWLATQPPAIFEVGATIDAVADLDASLSLIESGGLNEIGFHFFEPTNTWRAITTKAGATTATDTLISDTNPHVFRFEVQSLTSVKFYVDNVLKATHVDNIPTVRLILFYNIRAAAAVDTRLDLEFMDFVGKR
jgi:hypothetical protein